MADTYNALARNKKCDYLMDYTNDIILVIDPSGNIIEANKAALSAYGYKQSEFTAMTIFDLYEKKDLPMLKKFLSERLYNGISFKAAQIKKDGRRFYAESCWYRLESDSFNAFSKNRQLIVCVKRCD